MNELSNLKPLKVSLVKRGANLKKRFPITKSEEQEMDWNEVLKAVIITEIDQDKELDEFLKASEDMEEEGKKAIKAAMRILASFKEKIPEEAMNKIAALAGFESKRCSDEEMKKELDEVKKQLEEAKKGDSDMSMSEEIKKQFDDMRKEHQNELERVRKQLEEQTDANKLAEWISKAEKQLEFYPDKTAQELGAKLFKLEKADPELAKEQFEDMVNVSKKLEQSRMFEEVGVTGRGDQANSIIEIVAKEADEMIKANPKLTKEQAEAMVYKNNPKYYAAYLNSSK